MYILKKYENDPRVKKALSLPVVNVEEESSEFLAHKLYFHEKGLNFLAGVIHGSNMGDVGQIGLGTSVNMGDVYKSLGKLDMKSREQIESLLVNMSHMVYLSQSTDRHREWNKSMEKGLVGWIRALKEEKVLIFARELVGIDINIPSHHNAVVYILDWSRHVNHQSPSVFNESKYMYVNTLNMYLVVLYEVLKDTTSGWTYQDSERIELIINELITGKLIER